MNRAERRRLRTLARREKRQRRESTPGCTRRVTFSERVRNATSHNGSGTKVIYTLAWREHDPARCTGCRTATEKEWLVLLNGKSAGLEPVVACTPCAEAVFASFVDSVEKTAHAMRAQR